MNLYIVRHGIAVQRGSPGIDDSERALTEEGVLKMRNIAAALCRLKYRPELMLSSPLVRARQTAEILLQAFGKGIELKILSALAPSGVRRELYREISCMNKKGVTSLMIVGHQPSLGEIAGEIAFGSSKNFVELKKGGVCAIEMESVQGIPKGILAALLSPSIMLRINEKTTRGGLQLSPLEKNPV
jgi:phosphohistidine phosphatase